jgi:methylenetetrahydrofolate dehydrogenase (NADP+)/methenyltetrahydrofolate cyclohydrolase
VESSSTPTSSSSAPLAAARLLDGRAASRQLLEVLREEVSAGLRAGRVRPGLATVLVGEDPASQVYVRNKRKACEAAGLHNVHHSLAASTGQSGLLKLLADLNADPLVHGILVQLPLPRGFDYDENEVLAAIHPAKDADGFHPANQGALVQGRPGPVPCTPRGVMHLLALTGIKLAGKQAVVVGRSNIVGKPVALLLLREHATVTICHSRTQDLAAEVARAEVLIAAVGAPGLVKGEWIRPGAVVVDVGINRLPDGSLVGDVDFAAAAQRASWITPVPGGVGPMTIAMLLRNTVDLAWPKN